MDGAGRTRVLGLAGLAIVAAAALVLVRSEDADETPAPEGEPVRVAWFASERRPIPPGHDVRPAVDDSRVELTGTLSVLGADGEFLRQCETGSFVLASRAEGQHPHAEKRILVRFEGGEWRCLIPKGRWLRAYGVRGDGENLAFPHNLGSDDSIDFPASGVLALEAFRLDDIERAGRAAAAPGR